MTASAVRSREVAIAAVLVACAPLVLLVFNRDWFITSDGIDQWNYVGFFHQYANPQFAPGAYKLGRLPWILIGFLVNTVFPPMAATYALHGLFLCLTTLAMFAALYLLLGRLALAAVIATLFGFYTQAHGVGGWDYHDTPTGAFYLLTVAMLAWPTVVAGRTIALILMGAVTAVAVHTHLELVNFLPSLAFMYLTIVRVRTGAWLRPRAIAVRLGWALLGAVLITLVLCVINWMVGREFLFFRVLVNMAAAYVSDADEYQARYWRPWSSGWVLTARYLSLPAAVALAGAVTLIRRRAATTAAEQIGRAMVSQYVFIVVVFIAWQTAGQTALDWNAEAYPVTPASFIGLAGLLVVGWPEACERRWLAATIGTIVLSTIYLSGVLGFFVEAIWTLSISFIGITAAIAFGVGLLAYLSRPRLATMVAFVVMFGLGNSVIARGPNRYYASDPCKIQPAVYGAIVDAALWLGALDPTFTRVRTWFDEHEQIEPQAGCTVAMRRVGEPVTSMAFLPYVTATPLPMPVEQVPESAVRSLVGGDFILAVISSRNDRLERWSRRLDAMGLSHEEVARHDVPVLGSTYTIHAWRIEQRVPTDARFDAPVIDITKDTPRALNVYGTPKGRLHADGDRLEFQPTDARDHVAYPFVSLPQRASESWARVVVDAPAAAAPSCRVVLQADDFTALAMLKCASATQIVRVPPATRSIRVYLADTTQHAFVLPRRIDVALSVSKP